METRSKDKKQGAKPLQKKPVEKKKACWGDDCMLVKVKEEKKPVVRECQCWREDWERGKELAGDW